MLLTPHNLISMDDSQFELSGEDILAIFSLINSKCRVNDVDYWMNVCLPSVSEEAYVNMYYRNIASCMGLVLISSNPENIAEAVMMCQKIEISLQEEKLTEMITKYARMLPLEPSNFNLIN